VLNLRKRLDLLLLFWPFARYFNEWIRRPPFANLFHRWFSPENNQFISIPIQHTFEGTESVALPRALIPSIVEKASACFLMDHCLCRQAEHCSEYPVETGCLFLGDGALKIPPSMGRLVNQPEALDHVQRAVDAGLVPTIIHSLFDACVLGIPHQQTVGICFCCECCCTVRNGLKLGPPALQRGAKRLPGLSVRVGDTCTLCGICAASCSVEAMHPGNFWMEIDDRCLGCGQCAAVCPVDAISIELNNLSYTARTVSASIETWMTGRSSG
jgi:ferredoxin